MKFIILAVLIIPVSIQAQFNPANSQFSSPPNIAQTFAATVDAAVGYSAWALDNNENSFKRIGAFKVKGTPYLFGGAYKGDVFAKNQNGKNVVVGYDTYQQQLEIYLGSKDPIVKHLTEIDSFSLKADSTTFFKETMVFVNAHIYDTTMHFFLMQVYDGKRFSLFKKYQSTLGVVSENYVQVDLRQFDLAYEFYYVDKLSKGLHKIKLTPKYLKNEFNELVNIRDLLILEELNRNPQFQLLKIFLALNSL